MTKILKASDIVGKYIPEDSEKRNIISKPDHFKMSGDGVFHTIQGEGPRLGYPITFVRLHFCNLACTFCDTWYTWATYTKEYYSEPWDLAISDLHETIKKAQEVHGVKEHIYRLNFTGGEPLIQQLKIVTFLKSHPEYYAECETNGTIKPDPYLLELNQKGMFFFNCSPKLASSGNPHLRRYRPEVLETIAKTNNPIFKFVCSTEKDVEDVLEEFGHIVPKQYISIMPEGVTKEENAAVYENIMPAILKHGLATHGRLQNVAFDGSKRGV